MIPKIVVATLAAVLVFVGFIPSMAIRPVYAEALWNFGFPGDPATPQPFSHPDWDVLVHNRDIDTYFLPFAAQHGPGCAAPPATHTISDFKDAVFLCHNHVMTAADSQGYAAIYLTPDRMIDFSGGTATMGVSVSTLRTSMRDWIDFWITPYDSNLMAPLVDWLPDLQGPPQNAVHVEMGNTNGGTNFGAEVFRNYLSVDVPSDPWLSLESLVQPSAAVRVPYQLSISQTHIKFGIPSLNAWWIDTDIAPLPFTQGIVQIGHHSYTPEKDCVPSGTLTCQPNTWHWSDFSIAPTKPFGMLHGDKPFVDYTASTTVSFPAPAPARANLRFHGQGALTVSFDGGKSFQPAVLAAQSVNDPGHMNSYWMPVPAGTGSVVFGGGPDPLVGVGPFARDISIWSR